MFWAIVGALLFVFIGIPILLNLVVIKEFWYFVFGVIVVIGIIIGIILLSDGDSGSNTNYQNKNMSNSQQSFNPSNSYNNKNENTFVAPVKNINEKCVDESYIKICDLKYSSRDISTTEYRDVLAEGNNATCVDMSNGTTINNVASRIRAKDSQSFCVSDFGYIYIDPTIRVNKFYGKIYGDNLEGPFKVPKQYDTCVWTYTGGTGLVSYIETLSNIGPRDIFNIASLAAFCRNDNSQIDIYTAPISSWSN